MGGFGKNTCFSDVIKYPYEDLCKSLSHSWQGNGERLPYTPIATMYGESHSIQFPVNFYWVLSCLSVLLEVYYLFVSIAHTMPTKKQLPSSHLWLGISIRYFLKVSISTGRTYHNFKVTGFHYSIAFCISEWKHLRSNGKLYDSRGSCCQSNTLKGF